MLKVSGRTKLVFNMFFKLILAMIIGCTLMLTMLFISYKPTYKVCLADEEIGYIANKRFVQKEIEDYLQNGDVENVGYVIQRNAPTYEFALVKKDIETSDDKVVAMAKDECEVYYRVYGINVGDSERFVVESLKEAQELVDTINKEQKQYKTKATIEISEKFVKEYDLVDDVKVAVNSIIKEVEKENNKVVAKTNIYAASTRVVPKDILLALHDSNVELNFKKPLENGILTSRYGIRSLGNHKGIDYAAPIGTPIHVAEAGIVTYVGWMNGYGMLVIVDHPAGYQTYYGHCSKYNTEVGAEVNQGDVIAYVGNTGRSTGPHVHFEMRIEGKATNPANFLNEI